MEHGPLPPHERSWRHPSELGPTAVDVEDTVGRSYGGALAGGAVAMLAVAAMVVAITPRAAPGPIALSASTTSVISSTVATREAAGGERTTVRVQSLQLASPAMMLTSFSSYPHSVTSAPQFDLDNTEIAAAAPDVDDSVFVRTDAVTYRLRWGDATSMRAPEGSMVFDDAGHIVAYVTGGELVSLVDG